MKPAMKPAEDRGESLGLMEPLVLGGDCRARAALSDLALELAQKSAGLHRGLPLTMVASLADLVRSMNCYYSNLIEGHDTHPIDIERALKHDYSADPTKRDLQLEAIAHIAVQKWIDPGGLQDRATSGASIREIHRRFYAELPQALRWVEDPDTGEKHQIMAGELYFGDAISFDQLAMPRGMLEIIGN